MVACERLTAELLPPAFGLPVVHDHVRLPQPPRDTEGVRRSVHARVENDRGIAQRAVGDSNRHTADDIVGNLMPGQHLQGVGLGFTVHFQPDNRLGWGVALCGFSDGYELRRVDRRNTVARRSTGKDFPVVHDRSAEVPQWEFPVPRARVVLRGKQGLRARDTAPQRGQQGERNRRNGGKAKLSEKG